MQNRETFIVHAPDAEKAKKDEKPYNPEFVKKILESQKQFEEGKYTNIKTDDIWK